MEREKRFDNRETREKRTSARRSLFRASRANSAATSNTIGGRMASAAYSASRWPATRAFEPQQTGSPPAQRQRRARAASADRFAAKQLWSSKMKRWWRFRCTISCANSVIPWSARSAGSRRRCGAQPAFDRRGHSGRQSGRRIRLSTRRIAAKRNIPFVFATGYSRGKHRSSALAIFRCCKNRSTARHWRFTSHSATGWPKARSGTAIWAR